MTGLEVTVFIIVNFDVSKMFAKTVTQFASKIYMV